MSLVNNNSGSCGDSLYNSWDDENVSGEDLDENVSSPVVKGCEGPKSPAILKDFVTLHIGSKGKENRTSVQSSPEKKKGKIHVSPEKKVGNTQASSEKPVEKAQSVAKNVLEKMMSASRKIQVVDSKLFDIMFKEFEPDTLSVLTKNDSYAFDLKNRKMVVTGSASSLCLGIVCCNAKGEKVMSGVGKFSRLEIQKFLTGEESLIHEFLGKATDLFPQTHVLAAGMYNEAHFAQVKELISMSYSETLCSFTECSNPWNVGQDIVYNPDISPLEKYLTEFDYSLELGIAKNGSVHVASFSPYGCNTFRQFDEREFEEWKVVKAKMLAISKMAPSKATI